MFRKKDAEVYYINERSRSASEELASLFSYCIQKDGRMFRELVFLCIGSDRITGDSLGPLIGYQLSPYCSRARPDRPVSDRDVSLMTPRTKRSIDRNEQCLRVAGMDVRNPVRQIQGVHRVIQRSVDMKNAAAVRRKLVPDQRS